MTGRNKASRHKRTDIRTIPKEAKTPRPPTPSEVRADNLASFWTDAALMNIRSWVGAIGSELERMNSGKVGRPYLYCDSMIIWILTFMGYNRMTFRKAAGTAAGILSNFGLASPSVTTLFRRFEKFVDETVLGAPPEDGRVYSRYVSPHVSDRVRRVAVDSTGLNLSATTLWRENKWGVGPAHRGWLKLHALADVDSGEILAYVLTDDQVGDSPMLDELFLMARGAGHRMSVLYADNAYDSAEHWKLLASEKVRFLTRFRSDTTIRSYGCLARGEATKLWKKVGKEDWAEVTGYGVRWKVESVFSDLKRLTSETVSARIVSGMIREVHQKIVSFNIHKRIRADLLGITGNDIQIGCVEL